MVYLSKKYDFYSLLEINVNKLWNFMKIVEEGYKENPYHNAMHAADVT